MNQYSHIIDFIRHNYSKENQSPDITNYVNRIDNLKLIDFTSNFTEDYSLVKNVASVFFNGEYKKDTLFTTKVGFGNAFIGILKKMGIGNFKIEDYCSYPIQDKNTHKNLKFVAVVIKNINSNKESFGIGIGDPDKDISTVYAIISAINRF